jgi:hypothetical protein
VTRYLSGKGVLNVTCQKETTPKQKATGPDELTHVDHGRKRKKKKERREKNIINFLVDTKCMNGTSLQRSDLYLYVSTAHLTHWPTTVVTILVKYMG